MICSTKQNVGPSTSTSPSVCINDETDAILNVSISSPSSLISENKFAPLKVEDSQHIPDFSPNVHRIFHNDSSTDRIRKEGLQLMALEENIILPLPNEETIEIESVTELEPVAFMQKKEGKLQRKGEASLNSNKKLTREVKALLGIWER